MNTLLLATRNAHKVEEIRAILGPHFQYWTLVDFPDAPVVTEDADTFAGNAIKKATELAQWLVEARRAVFEPRNGFVLADDSGLEVDALNGEPGIHSARFAALDTGQPGNSRDADNNAKLLRLLRDVPTEQRTARFRCVIALVECHPTSSILHPRLFDGRCEGRIGLGPRGANGFGYDPLFTPAGHTRTLAELAADVKNRLSHRARALAAAGVALSGK